MSILTSASSASVRRGYDYYNRDLVSQIAQLNDEEYEGYVEGSLKEPYYVKINVNHPRKSYCDCPHANGNITCKHMVALYFSLFQEEADDYEAWLESDYDEEEYEDYYDDYRYYNDYDDYYRDEKYEKPLFFEEVLNSYVEDLSNEKLKEILKDELMRDVKRTFDTYLKKDYSKYLKQNNESFVFLDRLNKKIKGLTDFYDYNYNDFDKPILTSQEKNKIEKLYKDVSLKGQIDKILFVPELSAYSGYRWIANFYKRVKPNIEIEEFIHDLENYLDSLKHYSIKNSVPKSNVLICIYLLKNLSLKETAESLIKNAKYIGYVEYVIENHENYMELYNEVMKILKKNYFRNKPYIPDVLYRFLYVSEYENDDIYYNYSLYGFLCTGDITYLNILDHLKPKNIYVKEIESRTKDVFLLIKLYSGLDMNDKLWDLLNTDNRRYLFINNIDGLKEKHSKELYNYFIGQFYDTLKMGKLRENYKKATRYVEAISKLNDGDILVNNLIEELRKSEYQKCSALFDEINKSIAN